MLLAGNGVEAIRLAEAEGFDLAILDINMPGMNGFEAAQRIRKIAPAAPIVFFTAYDDDCVKERRSQLAAACVEKTDDLTELKRIVARLLQLQEGAAYCRSGLPPPPVSPAAVVPMDHL